MKKTFVLDPSEYYSDAAKEGLARINRRVISLSKNVVEFQPYAYAHDYVKHGEAGLFRACVFWIQNGYIKV